MKKLMNKKGLILLLAIPFLFVLFLFIVGLLSNLGQGNKLPISNSPVPEKTGEIRKLNPIAITKENLIGIWHECPSMPSSWCNHYNLYPSGKFRLYTESCSGNKVDESGSWELNGVQLKLTIKEETLLRGGKVIRGGGSCGQILEGAIPEFNVLDSPKIETHALKSVNEPVIWGRYTYQLNEMLYSAIYMDGNPYWKFSDDPVYGGDFPENITLVQAIEMAKKELKKRGYEVEAAYFKTDPASFIRVDKNGWDNYLSQSPKDFQKKTLQNLKLEGKNYWVLHYQPNNQKVMGGDAWVFVDRDSGSIIGTILGQ